VACEEPVLGVFQETQVPLSLSARIIGIGPNTAMEDRAIYKK